MKDKIQITTDESMGTSLTVTNKPHRLYFIIHYFPYNYVDTINNREGETIDYCFSVDGDDVRDYPLIGGTKNQSIKLLKELKHAATQH